MTDLQFYSFSVTAHQKIRYCKHWDADQYDVPSIQSLVIIAHLKIGLNLSFCVITNRRFCLLDITVNRKIRWNCHNRMLSISNFLSSLIFEVFYKNSDVFSISTLPEFQAFRTFWCLFSTCLKFLKISKLQPANYVDVQIGQLSNLKIIGFFDYRRIERSWSKGPL